MTDYARLRACRLFVLDMDGTLYLGDEVLPGAIDFVRALTASGRRYVYLTNNSSRAGADYVPRLRRLGFPCAAEDVFSSGMATALYLKERHPGARVCLVGNAALRRELESYGVTVSDGDADVVVAGFDTELTYAKLERAVHHLRRGVPFLACNPDRVCPMPKGEVLPDCGSICALLTAAGGAAPTTIGKPNRRMLDLLSAQTGVPNAEICCVGDRLYTDIAVGVNAGAVTAAVLSGETTRSEIAASDVKPDYVFPCVADITPLLK
jgi:HAD superfamily hydrolase (TIGR01450 family)